MLRLRDATPQREKNRPSFRGLAVIHSASKALTCAVKANSFVTNDLADGAKPRNLSSNYFLTISESSHEHA